MKTHAPPRPTLLLAALLAAACGDKDADDTGGSAMSDMSGGWSGTCAVEGQGYLVDVGLQLELVQEGGATLASLMGEASSDYSGEDWEGMLTGTRAGDTAEATLELSLEDEFEITVTLDGALEPDLWTGACALGDLAGSFELTRA